MMEKLPLVKYRKLLSNFQISANFTKFSSFLATSSRYACPRIISKGFPSSLFLFFQIFFSSCFCTVNYLHRFLCFFVLLMFFFFPCFIDIGNFPALTSLLSIDDLTGSTVIPLIPHESGEHASKNIAEKYS